MDPSGLVVVGLAAPRPWDSYSWVSCQLKWEYLGVIRVILLVSLIGLRPVPRRSTHRAGFIFIRLRLYHLYLPSGSLLAPREFCALRGRHRCAASARDGPSNPSAPGVTRARRKLAPRGGLRVPTAAALCEALKIGARPQTDLQIAGKDAPDQSKQRCTSEVPPFIRRHMLTRGRSGEHIR